MTIVQDAEVAGIDFSVNFLTNQGPALETELGPLELQLIDGGIKIADAWFNKLGPALGGMLNGLLEGYAGKLPAELNSLVDKGREGLIDYLGQLRAHIVAS